MDKLLPLTMSFLQCADVFPIERRRLDKCESRVSHKYIVPRIERQRFKSSACNLTHFRRLLEEHNHIDFLRS